MKQKIFISGLIPKIAYEKLSKEFDVTMHNSMDLLTKEQIIKGIDGKDALLCLLSNTIDKGIICSNPNLKVIANYGAGFNNIDVETATAKKIPVTNTPIVSTTSTAELTLGLIISIARRIVEGDKITRSGNFTGWSPLFHLGNELSGKTLGIIGMGNIGKAVAKRAHAFDMNIIYYSPHPLLDKALEKDYKYEPFEEVIKNSDFLTLHCSYNASSFHMIGQNEFKKMKSTAYLINAARGPLVDEKALLKALQEKSIAGAALDVYENEPEITAGLEKLDNVILTPHIGNATVEARNAMAEIAANNIISALKNQKPENCINPEIY